MYIAPGSGRQPTRDKNFMTTGRPFLFAHMLQVSKWSLQNLISYTFLIILYMYIAPSKCRKPLGDKLLMSTESPYHFDHLLQVSNKSLWSLILYTFFNVFPHVYSPGGRGRQPFVDKILMSTEKPCHLAYLLQVSKIYLWNLILYIIFHIFMHVYSPGAGTDNPWGQNLYINIFLLSLWSFAVSFFH